ncbi:MAG: carbohydrate kinase family protein [Vicinamibacterales bacterium]
MKPQLSPATVCDVIGVGASSHDTVYRLPTHPRPDAAFAKIRIREVLSAPGGQTATAMAACASLGLRARFAGTFGRDERGRFVRDALAARQVDVSLAPVKDATNQFAVILIDDSTGERIVLWDRDDRLRLQPDDLPWEAFGTARLLHVDDVDEDAAILVAEFGRSRGIPVTSDLDRITARTETLVSRVAVPVFAEHLPGQLTGESDMERALRRLRRLNEGLLVVTLGAAGAMALEGDDIHLAPGFAVPAVDTTGSGDVFRAGLITGLLAGWDVPRMLRFANAAAALSCTRVGAMASVPTFGEVRDLVAGRARQSSEPGSDE